MWAALSDLILQVIAVLSIMTMLIGYFAPILHLNVERNTLIAVGNVAFFIAVFLLIVADRKKREKLQAQLQPRLAILYEPREPYEHVTTYPSGAIWRQCSIGIQNIGLPTIEEVRVYLKEMRPPLELSTGPDIDRPVQLGLMHEDRLRKGTDPKKPALHSGEIEYIDIVSKWEGQGPNADRIRMYYGIGNQPTHLSCRRYEFTIEATGRNVTPISRRFVIDIDSAGRLTFGPKMD